MFQRYNGWELSEDSDGPFYKKVDVDPKIKQLESANEKLTVDKAVLIGLCESVKAKLEIDYANSAYEALYLLRTTLEKVQK